MMHRDEALSLHVCRPFLLPKMRPASLSTKCFSLLAASIALILLLHVSPCEADPWKKCAATFQAALQYDANGNVSRYRYIKRDIWWPANKTIPLMLTEEGCKVYCGGGPKLFSWDDITTSFSTWVLPFLGGLLLHMPIESSNSSGITLLQLARCLGNPLRFLECSLRNLRDTERACRLFNRLTSADCTLTNAEAHRIRATGMPVDGQDDISSPDHHSHTCQRSSTYAALRDGLYILTVLNQYDVRPGVSDGSPSALEHVRDMYVVLIFALFSPCTGSSASAVYRAETHGVFRSRSDRHCTADPCPADLRHHRAALADYLRATCKRGVVPVLVTVFFFTIALAVSLARAFRVNDSSWHDYSLSLLISWLPGLVTCAVVDRNPTSSSHARDALQLFLDAASAAATTSALADAVDTTSSTSGAREAATDGRSSELALPAASVQERLGSVSVPERAVTMASGRLQPGLSTRSSQDGHLAGASTTSARAHSNSVEHPFSACALSILAATEPSLARRTTSAPHPEPLSAPRILQFCGQGQRLWHSGVAHPILTMIERHLGIYAGLSGDMEE
jgi:hypothetical protein